LHAHMNNKRKMKKNAVYICGLFPKILWLHQLSVLDPFGLLNLLLCPD
jgi:hypothetical protein